MKINSRQKAWSVQTPGTETRQACLTTERSLMLQQVYSIRDQKAECFNPPFFKNTHGEAERDFHQLVNDEKSFVAKYPKDFDLYHLGTFDTTSGKMQPLDAPVQMIAAVQMVTSTPPIRAV